MSRRDFFSKMPMMLFPGSSSRLDMALCGFAFNQYYGKNADPGIVWENLVYGTDIHDIFDIIMKKLMDDPETSIPINDLVRKHISPRIAHRCNEMIEHIDLFIEYLKQSWCRIDPRKVVGSELRLAVDNRLKPCGYNDVICENGHVTEDGMPRRAMAFPSCSCGARTRSHAIWRGLIDLLEIHKDEMGLIAVVTDYKSQGNIIDKDELWEHFQLAGYAWLVHRNYPDITRFRIQIYFIRYGFVRWVEFTLPSPGQVDDDGNPVINLFAQWEQRFQIRVERILDYTEEDLQTPQPGDYCGLCDYHHICPLMQRVKANLGGSVFIEGPEDGVRAAKEYFAAQALVKDYKKQLEPHVARHGPVEIGCDKPVLKYRTSQGNRWEAKDVFDLFVGELGWEPADIMDRLLKVDTTEIKKVMKKELSKIEATRVLSIAERTEKQAFTFVKRKKISGELKD